MRLTIAFTVSGLRPDYLRRALDSWHAARGVQDCELLFCVEPSGSFDPSDLQDGVSAAFRTATVYVNKTRLGCAANTRYAMQRAFEWDAGFAVLAEEDMVVSTDAVEYFTWAAQAYRKDKEVTAACGHAFRMVTRPDPAAVVRRPWFNPQVWGTWPDRWEQQIDPGWVKHASGPWDANLRDQVHANGACIFPQQSRAQHIGAVSTLTNASLADYWFTSTLSSCFEQAVPSQRYAELADSVAWGLVV